MRTRRITITYIRSPREVDINTELQYLAGSLGLFNPRDKDKSKFRIFIALVKAIRQQQHGLSSDDLADQCNLTRATVIYHINNLVHAGIVEQTDGRYALRVNSLEELVEKIRRDVNRTLTELEGVAQKCDEELGL